MSIVPHNPTPAVRVRLQSMTVEQIVTEAHAMSENNPRVFPTPQHAWTHLRLCMEPEPWDVQHEYGDCGNVTVAVFGGETVLILPHSLTSYQRAWDALQAMFEGMYPVHLIDLATPLVARVEGGLS